jgi:hypothetical protein
MGSSASSAGFGKPGPGSYNLDLQTDGPHWGFGSGGRGDVRAKHHSYPNIPAAVPITAPYYVPHRR